MGNSNQAQPVGGSVSRVTALAPWSNLWPTWRAVDGFGVLGGKTLAAPRQGSFQLWAPWAFCAGAAGYFYPAREPLWLWPASGLLLCAAGLVLLRKAHSPGAGWGRFSLSLVLALIAGWSAAQWRSHARPTPVLSAGTHVYKGHGMVLRVDKEHGRRARFLIAPQALGRIKDADMPTRIRISALAGDAEPGQNASFTAALQAPAGAPFAGGYDFARSAWFMKLGGSGFAYGHVRVIPAPAHVRLTAHLRLAQARRALAVRIREGLKGQKGAIAAALVTGDRSTISEATKKDLRTAGLAHMLAISGLHMGLVAGLVFAVTAMGLALLPGIGERYDCRKPAALAGLGVATGYLLLSGASAPTQRAFVMIAMVFVAVLMDRRALSLRTVSLSAFVVAALAPQNVITPGFQMSFAAALALIAFYEWAGAHGPLMPAIKGGGVWSLPGRFVLTLIALALTSLIAGLATGPFAAFYFHRTAVYGLLGNIAAMPVFTFVVMPALLAGTLLSSVGAGAPFFALAGWGLDFIIHIAHWVATAPGALHRVAAAPAPVLAVLVAGLLMLALVQSRWRLFGVVLMAVAGLFWMIVPRPVGYIGKAGGALRIPVAGQPRILGFGDVTAYDLEQFAGVLGLPGAAVLPMRRAQEILPCDASGCTVHLRGGALLAVNLEPGRLAEDCRLAGLVISTRVPMRRNGAHCAKGQIIGPAWGHEGAMLLYRTREGVRIRRAPPRRRLWDQAAPYAKKTYRTR